MKKKILVFTLCIWALFTSVALAEYYPGVINIEATGDGTINISVRAIETQDKTYISIDDVLKGSGYQLGWESFHGAVIVYNPVICQNMYVYLSENKIWDGEEFIYYTDPYIIENGCAYITEQMLADLTRHSFTYEIKSVEAEDKWDKYRRLGEVKSYNGIYLLNGYYAFEKVEITDEMAIDYASAVNAVAEGLPQEVNVYNMAIPNSGEYYAPKEYSSNLKSAYGTVYENLSDRVTAVDICEALFNHGNDFIFFNSDHHWTHRGAYYAFKEFMQLKGTPLEYEYINVFGRQNSKNVVGSFANLMKDTEGATLISHSPELLERFIPPYTITKDVYNDCRLEKYVASGPLINKNLLSYSTFIGGDVPVAKLHNSSISDGSALCIIKDSYANAFATWAACNYEYVYLVDIRCFNGANGMEEPFNINTFHETTGFNDLLIMSYPNTIADYVLRDYIRMMG